MGSEFWVAGLSALWLGILTSISPCPLATNVAAVSYLCKGLDHPRRVLVTGVLYAIGRVVVYVALAVLILSSLLSASGFSLELQRIMNRVLGPLLVLVGMVLLGLLPMPVGRGGRLSALGERLSQRGLLGSLLLGVLFALAFCPSSAALYFGSLIPLSLHFESPWLFPLAYGMGTAVPVLVFAIAIAMGVRAVSRAFSLATTFERWARIVTGVLFTVLGVYFSLVQVFQVL